MDINVVPDPDGTSWKLIDLLGRSVGRIDEVKPGEFVIGMAVKVAKANHPSLDAALLEIERATKSSCRVVPADV